MSPRPGSIGVKIRRRHLVPGAAEGASDGGAEGGEVALPRYHRDQDPAELEILKNNLAGMVFRTPKNVIFCHVLQN